MSGPICPDCGFFDIDEKNSLFGKKNICTFCGWEGELLPRKILSSDQYVGYGEEHRNKRDLREVGKLHFMRIHVKDDDDVQDDITFNLMDILELESLCSPDSEPPYFFIEISEKPSAVLLKKIKVMKGVKKVKIF